ncbi:glycoside hydrolase family 15 protein [soil metagenome]
MGLRIEDYGLIGDCESAALVGNNGSIDWLCLPRFDSGACFAGLLGTRENGHWQISPSVLVKSVSRRYVGDTLVLETLFETSEGSVAVLDFMPLRQSVPDLIRIVEGRSGQVPLRMDLTLRFDYGSVVPWVHRDDDGVTAIAGPDAVHLHSDVPTHGENLSTVADFTVAEGQRVAFVLTWYRSFDPPPKPILAEKALTETLEWWREWSARCKYEGVRRDLVLRSLITLKALTYAPSGGIVAAVTTSLPEQIGGVRNWDYRYCWLRDATLTLLAFINGGYIDEARAWQDWLLRAVAGNPQVTQIMYGLAGERRLDEYEVPWLAGYEGSQPVRVGNAAHSQFQLDVYGEVADALYHANRAGLKPETVGWNLQCALIRHVERVWMEPDEGIWEMRGPRRHFTHSKVMAWVAMDRAVKTAEHSGLEAPLERWRFVRDAIHEQVCRDGFDASINSFVQSYGTKCLDASLLMIPLVGFLPADDPRVRGTADAIERHLMHDGFVLRYDTARSDDGLPPGEGAFLPCTYWLADNYALRGDREKAREVFDRLAALCNDVGLLSEEYDPKSRRLVGNFPQAFSHVGLVNTAMNLSLPDGPAEQRMNS